jgi:predicted metal-dependent phosphoesterase TrpH
MIDLHMHTTASDGRHPPEDLVPRVRAAGIHTFAIADHDTVAAVAKTARLAREAGLAFVPGVEITAVYNSKDVHMLGYFFDPESPGLVDFLERSLRDRLRRARLMSDRLAELGVPIDIDRLIEATGGPNSGKAIARPVIAKALLEAGHVLSIQEAFDKYLAEGQPAYFGRFGASPVEVVGIVHAAGGLASFAHPGALGKDELIPELVAGGLDAIECYHSEHTPEMVAKYLGVAREHGLGVTGGSDFHGEGTRRSEFFGRVSLPAEDFERLLDRVGRAARS